MQVCKQAAAETPIGTAVSEATCGDTNRYRCVYKQALAKTPIGIGAHAV